MLNVISLGAGVQSSTMALMAAHGEIEPMPDCAIFADTGAEPKKIYEWLGWLEKQLPFPVHRVSHGNIRDDIVAAVAGNIRTSHLGQPPFFSIDDKKDGMLWRKCTSHYKIHPLEQKVRQLCGLKPGERGGKSVLATQWIGISSDEAQRMKPSGKAYIVHRWPLIDLNMSRHSCLQWMKARNYPSPTKSSCTFCPYHDDGLWRDMKRTDPESWSDAVKIDQIIAKGIPAAGANFPLYLHKSGQRLEEVDLRNAEDAGQLSMFGNECEGMCGV
jgi:hypothetical protein